MLFMGKLVNEVQLSLGSEVSFPWGQMSPVLRVKGQYILCVLRLVN